tara:strand:+ start:134 stop:550 length:417 start_codon:yes stop_codon:yes gene_type:complete
MRPLKRIIIHCSATPEGRDIDAATIKDWHVNGNGWSDIGYHYVIKIDGCLEVGRQIDKVGAHCKGHNKDSIGICYVGGADKEMQAKDTMNEAQESTMRELIYSLRMVSDSHLTLHGHNEYATKLCPSFRVSEKFKDIL